VNDIDPRVYFAAERTLLAWVRTGVTVIGLGFVVARFGMFLKLVNPAHADMHRTGLATALGTALVVAGGVFTSLAALQFLAFLRSLQPQEKPRPAFTAILGLLLAFSTSAIALLLAIYLVK
jgi:putative membrane protein